MVHRPHFRAAVLAIAILLLPLADAVGGENVLGVALGKSGSQYRCIIQGGMLPSCTPGAPPVPWEITQASVISSDTVAYGGEIVCYVGEAGTTGSYCSSNEIGYGTVGTAITDISVGWGGICVASAGAVSCGRGGPVSFRAGGGISQVTVGTNTWCTVEGTIANCDRWTNAGPLPLMAIPGALEATSIVRYSTPVVIALLANGDVYQYAIDADPLLCEGISCHKIGTAEHIDSHSGDSGYGGYAHEVCMQLGTALDCIISTPFHERSYSISLPTYSGTAKELVVGGARLFTPGQYCVVTTTTSLACNPN